MLGFFGAPALPVPWSGTYPRQQRRRLLKFRQSMHFLPCEPLLCHHLAVLPNRWQQWASDVGFPGQQSSMLWNQAGTLEEKPSGTQSLVREFGSPKVWAWSQVGRVIYSRQLPYLWGFSHMHQTKEEEPRSEVSKLDTRVCMSPVENWSTLFTSPTRVEP